MRVTVAVLDKCGGNAVAAVASALERIDAENQAHFRLVTPSKVVETKNPAELLAQTAASSVAIGMVSKVPNEDGMFKLKMHDLTVAFEGRIYAPNLDGAIAEFLTERLSGDTEKEAATFLKEVEGDFSLLIAQENKLTAARDPVGIQPLYYGETEAVAALASNRKTLWKLGISEPKSFPPGHVGTATQQGFGFKPVQILAFDRPKRVSVEEASVKLQRLLEESVQRRIAGQRKVAVAFSGGLDSSLVAFLAKKCGVDVCLLHVSLEGQPETEEAHKAAGLLGLPLDVHLFAESDLEKAFPKVVELIEEPDPVKASVGVPFYWNAQKAMEAGFYVMLAGQGADELFGGYKRYLNEYLSNGAAAVRKTMFHDVAVIHESNLERDMKICGFFDVELRLPFASFEIAKFATSLPTKLKLEKKEGSLRKLVLRRTAVNLGLPREIVEKPKKAVQYSTGVSGALKKIAKKHGFTLAEYAEALFEKSRTVDALR